MIILIIILIIIFIEFLNYYIFFFSFYYFIINYNYIVYLQELHSKTKEQGQENPLSNLSAEESKDIDRIHKATKSLELEIKHLLIILWWYLVFASIRIKAGDRLTIDYALISSSVETIYTIKPFVQSPFV